MVESASRPPAVVRIADLEIHAVTFEDTVDWILRRARSGHGGAVCTPNADYVVRAHSSPSFRAAIEAADLRVPDGMAIIYAARLAGRPLRSTVTGRLLLPRLAEEAAREGWSIALFGAGPGVATAAAAALERRLPGLEVVAAESPRMGLQIGDPDDAAAVERLRTSGARIIFVALGAPRQETWMANHREALDPAILIGVGAAFDIVAGRFREAPRWMTRVGLEWLFRLVQEPRRLARRYLVDDPWIFTWAVKTRLGGLRRIQVREP